MALEVHFGLDEGALTSQMPSIQRWARDAYEKATPIFTNDDDTEDDTEVEELGQESEEIAHAKAAAALRGLDVESLLSMCRSVLSASDEKISVFSAGDEKIIRCLVRGNFDISAAVLLTF
jgi:hypothetical protein